MTKLLKAARNPRAAVAYAKGSLKGHLYKAMFKLLGKKVTIGKNFKVHGSLNIQGPGRVIIGDNVTVEMDVTPWTNSEGAVLRIGNGVFLNGTRFGCAESITIGDGCILADCRILDTDFHGIDPKRRDAVKTAPIVIKDNVWITMDCIVLKGVTIAEGSTVTPASVVVKSLTSSNSIYGGNPAILLKEAA